MKIRNFARLSLMLALAYPFASSANDNATSLTSADSIVSQCDINLNTPWKGKRVAFLGDSMTDPRNKSTKRHYWKYLESLMGIRPHVYARSGFMWDGIYKKAEELHAALGDSIDVIMIWAGTNDYNHSIPLGRFFDEEMDSVNVNGKIVERKHRHFLMNDTTFTGNINRTLSYLKHTYPDKQIIIMTPIHRALANFNEKNVQPDENYANGQGLYIESYINTLKEGAMLWAIPVIDLYSDSGLFPLEENHASYFHNKQTDLLHPNDAGHYRIARTIQARLNAIAPTL